MAGVPRSIPLLVVLPLSVASMSRAGIFDAVTLHDLGKVRKYLAAEVDVDAGDTRGLTLLHVAALAPVNIQAAGLVPAEGADPKARDDKGQTALYTAERTGPPLQVIAELLRQRGATK